MNIKFYLESWRPNGGYTVLAEEDGIELLYYYPLRLVGPGPYTPEQLKAIFERVRDQAVAL